MPKINIWAALDSFFCGGRGQASEDFAVCDKRAAGTGGLASVNQCVQKVVNQ